MFAGFLRRKRGRACCCPLETSVLQPRPRFWLHHCVRGQTWLVFQPVSSASSPFETDFLEKLNNSVSDGPREAALLYNLQPGNWLSSERIRQETRVWRQPRRLPCRPVQAFSFEKFPHHPRCSGLTGQCCLLPGTGKALRAAEQTPWLFSAPSGCPGPPTATSSHSVVCLHHLFVCLSFGQLSLCVRVQDLRGESPVECGPLHSCTHLPNVCAVCGRLTMCQIPCQPLPLPPHGTASRFFPLWSCDLGALFTPVVQARTPRHKNKCLVTCSRSRDRSDDMGTPPQGSVPSARRGCHHSRCPGGRPMLWNSGGSWGRLVPG